MLVTSWLMENHQGLCHFPQETASRRGTAKVKGGEMGGEMCRAWGWQPKDQAGSKAELLASPHF